MAKSQEIYSTPGVETPSESFTATYDGTTYRIFQNGVEVSTRKSRRPYQFAIAGGGKGRGLETWYRNDASRAVREARLNNDRFQVHAWAVLIEIETIA